MKEKWAVVEGFPYYSVSNLGRVYSRRTERLMKPVLNNGFMNITLRRNGKEKGFGVHQLVAKAFVEGYFDGAEVKHIDGLNYNNLASNLKWMTCSEKSSKFPVRIVETGKIFESVSECARHINGHQSSISRCLNGHRQTHLGYTFERVKEDVG